MENQRGESELIHSNLTNDIILRNFDRLMFGDHITILYDNDPVSLYYDFLTYRDGLFEWKYLEAGPEVWIVKIKNMGQDFRTVADILLDNPKAAAAFDSFHIDYYNKGSRLFLEACKEMSLEPAIVLKRIDEATENPDYNDKANGWPLEFLIEYILVAHHNYVKDKRPAITRLTGKVLELHGEIHPVLYDINLIYNKMAEGLRLHMHKEEILLFPAIKKLATESESSSNCTLRTLENLITAMKTEHDKALECMENIRKISGDFQVPDDASNWLKLLYAGLQELEKDLRVQFHLENTILFPKALALMTERLS